MEFTPPQETIGSAARRNALQRLGDFATKTNMGMAADVTLMAGSVFGLSEGLPPVIQYGSIALGAIGAAGFFQNLENRLH